MFSVPLLRIQAPVEAAGQDEEWSLPEPDLAILAGETAQYHRRHPRGNELLLAVEVSDSSTAFDLSRKAALYAHAGVPEYWVLNLPRRRLVVHRRPEDETVSMEARAETVRVGDLLPRAAPLTAPPASAPGNPPPPAS